MASPGTRADVGHVKRLGQGLSRDVFVADVEFHPDAQGRSGFYTALVPSRVADAESGRRAVREDALLTRLARLSLPFRVPRPGIVVASEVGPILVREYVEGEPVELRADRSPPEEPWVVVGHLAAAVHAVDPAPLADLLPGPATRREAALADLTDLEEAASRGAPPAIDGLAWAKENLPPPGEPSCLVHGDLLGQNILRVYDGTQPVALIDWEYAERGDPAADLAVVTRGVRAPFTIQSGLRRLLDAYRGRGGKAVTAAHVRIHELRLIAGWYVRAFRRENGGHAPEHYLNLMASLLPRCEAASRSGDGA